MSSSSKRKSEVNSNENSGKKPKNPTANASNSSESNSEQQLLMLPDDFEKLDTNEKFYAAEDRISIEMGHQNIVHEFLEDAAVIKQALLDIIDGKKLHKNLVPRLAKMRRLSRLNHYATSNLKKQTANRLDEVDAKLLQLQNTNSEVQHIQKEIERCLGFSAGDEELNLIPVDEFYEVAPESISQPEITQNDPHKQYLARLEYEEEQRKQLQATLQELEGRRNVLASDIRGKEQRLQSLKPNISAMIKSAIPAQDILGAKYSDVENCAEQKLLSFSLAVPLSVLYVQAMAYKELMDDKHISVKINGTLEGSQKFSKKEEAEIDVKESENSIQKRVEESSSRIFETHPLNIDIGVECVEHDLTIIVNFQYIPELKVATMKWSIDGGHVISKETLLVDLFENDNGEKCPNAIGNVKLEHLKINFDSIAKTVGRPYKVVQALCGDVQEDGEADLTELMRKFIEAIRRRVDNRKMLEKIISDAVKTNSITGGLNIKISSFKSVEEEKFATSIPKSLSQLISSSNLSDFMRYRVEMDDETKKHRLTAWIAIPCDFPRRSPMFGLAMHSEKEEDQFLKDAEDQVNDIKSFGIETLSKQLSNIAQNFDLIISSTTE
ncbi:unnamed protein product [Caenorhabditis bovis]|uniref:Uncharacterized protein n=1 Tax=Caenorhabditis bovis TaxID=2654633 RepID=A0A8S1ENP6_9PELO|nr:unnamed protein product [Caenorhabditis bovis]